MMSLYKSVDSASGNTVFEVDDNGKIVTPVTCPASLVQNVAKTAEQTNNTTSLANDTHLTFPIGTGETWAGKITIYSWCHSAGKDIKWDIRGPLGCSLFYGELVAAEAKTTGTLVIPQTNRDQVHTIQFYAKTAVASGSITLRWAQDTLSALEPMTFRVGSFLQAYKVV